MAMQFDPEHADAVLAKNLNELTVEDRNNVLEDIHGVRNLPMEERDPSKMRESIEKMNVALAEIPVAQKTAFEIARLLQTQTQYVLEDKRRIQYLRAEEFDAEKAAKRFVSHLDHLYELFGKTGLMRPIYFTDLTKDEQNHVKGGGMQLLPCRDRTGRLILVACPLSKHVFRTMQRIVLYYMQEMASDERSQQFGIVMIFHHYLLEEKCHLGFMKDPGYKDKHVAFMGCLPSRISAIHFCFPNTPLYRLAHAMISLISPKTVRVRQKSFFGSLTECKYSLMAYGIPGEMLPVTASGRIKTLNQHRWIKYRREKDAEIQMGLSTSKGVYCPLLMDIPIGNSRNSTHFKNNPGAGVYEKILTAHFQNYDEADTDVQEKSRITWKVLAAVDKAGCRILVRDSRGWWTVALPDRARDKIAHDFRELRKKLAAIAEAEAEAKSSETSTKKRGRVELLEEDNPTNDCFGGSGCFQAFR